MKDPPKVDDILAQSLEIRLGTFVIHGWTRNGGLLKGLEWWGRLETHRKRCTFVEKGVLDLELVKLLEGARKVLQRNLELDKAPTAILESFNLVEPLLPPTVPLTKKKTSLLEPTQPKEDAWNPLQTCRRLSHLLEEGNLDKALLILSHYHTHLLSTPPSSFYASWFHKPYLTLLQGLSERHMHAVCLHILSDFFIPVLFSSSLSSHLLGQKRRAILQRATEGLMRSILLRNRNPLELLELQKVLDEKEKEARDCWRDGWGSLGVGSSLIKDDEEKFREAYLLFKSIVSRISLDGGEEAGNMWRRAFGAVVGYHLNRHESDGLVHKGVGGIGIGIGGRLGKRLKEEEEEQRLIEEEEEEKLLMEEEKPLIEEDEEEEEEEGIVGGGKVKGGYKAVDHLKVVEEVVAEQVSSCDEVGTMGVLRRVMWVYEVEGRREEAAMLRVECVGREERDDDGYASK
ncbi:hypothetical protein HDV05_000133 [Chytridiales sp. JEL 0842]|nr:hypothetical protein HDV05_000133 [Chytridiales sp. JEL 0842]